jgi:alkanesulfonate monooxygenase SsuD/methylene tetrahydromethanopterin reductase-like flavin-dependent oxidoreductase (luciferase family)
MSELPVQFGLVLPHFGAGLAPARVLEIARRAEASGFDSLWVRDRLVAGAPHGLLLEAGGTAFLEPLLTLAAVAAVTDRIQLGTAVLLPNRHPLRLAQEVGTLWHLAPERLLLGLGLGVGPGNFEPLGFDYEDRLGLFEETAEILRGLPAVDGLDHRGAHFSYEDLKIDPQPGARVPLYYGGVSRAAVRRAFQWADGWIAGRLPRDTFVSRMQLVDAYRADTGRNLDIATMPITLVDAGDGKHVETAREAVRTLARSAEGARDWIKPPSGHFEAIEDLAGLLISGTTDRCAEQVGAMLETGVTHIVFDLRLVFDDFERQVDLLAGQVIPASTAT